MDKSKKSGLLIIPDKNDKTTMPDDGLHAFVCPHCGNDVFEGEDIVSYEDYEGKKSYRCWGGFGYITYRWIPHKCTACNVKFLAWNATKSINRSVIGWYVALIVTVIAMCLSTAVAISINKTCWLADISGLIVFMKCIGNIEGETCDADMGVKEMVELADFPDDTKEQGNEEAKSIINESIKSACMASPNELKTAMMPLRW